MDRCQPGTAGAGLNLGRDKWRPIRTDESAGTTAKALEREADQSRRLGKQGFPPEADLVAESIAERIRQLQ
jgi:hypothetical protein